MGGRGAARGWSAGLGCGLHFLEDFILPAGGVFLGALVACAALIWVLPALVEVNLLLFNARRVFLGASLGLSRTLRVLRVSNQLVLSNEFLDELHIKSRVVLPGRQTANMEQGRAAPTKNLHL